MSDKTTPPFDLSNFLPYRLALVSSQVSRAFAARYRDEFGISITEWRVLAHLSQEAVSVREIHQRVDLEKSKVSRAADRLKAAGLITKVTDPTDRRLVVLSLTAEGEAMMARLIPIALSFQEDLEQRLGACRDGFADGLGALQRAAR